MTDYYGGGGGGGGCCRCCCSLIFTSGLTALFLWLSLRASNPTCSIQDFYVPALNATARSAALNSTIYFDLKLDNKNRDKGVYYDALNLTLYYGPNRSLPVANASFPAFYQGHKKKARRKQLVEARGVPWDTVSNGTAAVFRVDLATAVRFKILAWKTKKHKLALWAQVDVDHSGKKVHRKGIKLKSGAPGLGCHGAPAVLVPVLVVLVLVL